MGEVHHDAAVAGEQLRVRRHHVGQPAERLAPAQRPVRGAEIQVVPVGGDGAHLRQRHVDHGRSVVDAQHGLVPGETLDGLVQGGGDIVGRERLGQVVERAHAEPVHGVLAGYGGEDDEAGVVLAPQPLGDVDAVGAVQEDVQEHEVEGQRVGRLEQVVAAAETAYLAGASPLVQMGTDRVFEGFGIRCAVVNDGDSHRSLSSIHAGREGFA